MGKMYRMKRGRHVEGRQVFTKDSKPFESEQDLVARYGADHVEEVEGGSEGQVTKAQVKRTTFADRKEVADPDTVDREVDTGKVHGDGARTGPDGETAAEDEKEAVGTESDEEDEDQKARAADEEGDEDDLEDHDDLTEDFPAAKKVKAKVYHKIGTGYTVVGKGGKRLTSAPVRTKTEVDKLLGK